MRLNKFAAITCLVVFLQAHVAFACRFTVRDIGYVDLGTQRYVLYGYMNNDTPEEVASVFTQVSEAALIDSNITVEVVNADQQKDHPALEYLALWPTQSFPAAVLVSPDQQSLPVPMTKPNQPFRGTLESALNEIVSSPKRREILAQISRAFGVVLLIEGTDPEENQRAQKVVSAAVKAVADEIKAMPTAVFEAPVSVVVDRKSLAGERILLWSLGLEADKVDKPHAAVLYGRARWIGPLMKGEEISEGNLLRILSVIAADCECGFDISWTRGTMLPARWDEALRARSAKALGFDPENPMVKMEVSGILRTEYLPSGIPFGYVELSAEPEGASEPATVPVEKKEKLLPEPQPAAMASGEPAKSSSGIAFRKPLYFFGGLAGLIVIAGIVIFFRAKARNP
jgi:hypothetical protein